MVREPDATVQPTLQDNQLMSKHRVLSLKPQLRPEWRGQDGQSETEQPDHSASLCDSITSSTRIRFSVHTAPNQDQPFCSLFTGVHCLTRNNRNETVGSGAAMFSPTPPRYRQDRQDSSRDPHSRASRRARAGRRAAAEERLNHHGSMQSFDHSGSTDLEPRLR